MKRNENRCNQPSNENWFDAMVSFHNTIRFIRSQFDVPDAIAREIQHVAACWNDQAKCEAIALESHILCAQVGH